MRYSRLDRFKRLVTISLVLFLLFSTNAYANFEYDYITDVKNWTKIAIPSTYVQNQTIGYLGSGIGNFEGAQDLFIDKKDQLYVADTGNDRIVKLSKKGEVLAVFTGPEDKPFSKPQGVFVADDGDIYVADTNNKRIVHLSPEGKFVETFVEPDSNLYDKSYAFQPVKVYLDEVGYIYIINKEDYHGFIILDAYNRFRGYMAPTKLQFSFKDLLIRLFASEEQKEQLAKRLPPVHSNFVMHDDGMFYTTTLRTPFNQIKKLTSLGTNIFEENFYGELIDEEKGDIEPAFVDICVDDNGIISALNKASGKIYQYDPEGNLLTVFGGYGNWEGKFLDASSLVQDSEGKVYVLDAKLNNIQVFQPTQFINTVHEGIKLYYDGKYQEAVEPWEEILEIGPSYTVAHKGIAKALMKQGKYKEAMYEYEEAEDKEGYSAAFAEYRHELFRHYFGWIVLVVILLVYGLIKSLKYFKLTSDKAFKKTKTWRGVY